MTYVAYRDSIRKELQRHAAGLTWNELQTRLRLPYDRPCPSWTKQLEADIGLARIKGPGRALVWKVKRRSRGGN
jgi:hypothetical protein